MVDRARRLLTAALGAFLLSAAGCGSDDGEGGARNPASGGAQNSGGTTGSGASSGTGAVGAAGSSGGAGDASAGSAGSAGTSAGGTEGMGGTAGGSSGTGGSSGSAAGSGGSAGLDGGSGSDGGVTIPPPPELTWTRQGPVAPLLAIWGSSPSNIYAVGFDGAILHSSGDGNWTYQTTNTRARLTGIWGSGPNDIYVSALSNLILHSTGNGTWDQHVTGAGYTFRHVWGSGRNDVYVGGSGMIRSAGDGNWRAAGNITTNAVWGSSATDVYAAGVSSQVYRSRGDDIWMPQTTGAANLDDLWGTGATDIYAIGSAKIFHSTGNGQWTQQPASVPSAGLLSVWALDQRAVYVGAYNGTLLRSGGDGRWFSQQLPSSVDVDGIWGTSPENLYIATSGGVYHGSKP